jgi:hypothetical protein
MISASFEGIFESINKPTTPMVPAIIMITFQSTAKNTSLIGKILKITKHAAEASAI